MVVCLDDVHWADAASLELIGHLLRRRPRAPVLLVLAYRPGQAPDLLRTALAAPAGPDDLRVELGPLTPHAAAALLGERVGDSERSALYRESGGNPFFLDQLARGRGGGVSDRPLTSGELPPALVAACAEELGTLDPAARALAEGAAVAGDPFVLELAAAAAGQDEPAALAALDRLDAAGLVRATEVPRQFRFRHPILRRAAYDLAPAGMADRRARARRRRAGGGRCAGDRPRPPRHQRRRTRRHRSRRCADRGRPCRGAARSRLGRRMVRTGAGPARSRGRRPAAGAARADGHRARSER